MTVYRAIPTTYNGRIYRSRLESNIALLLDRLGIRFEYEPCSFLLDDGTHYMPDFWCPQIRLWIEVRGYSSDKGDRQIDLFGQAVADRRLDSKKMLHPKPDTQHSQLKWWSDNHAEWVECRCAACQVYLDSDRQVDYMVLSPNYTTRFYETPCMWTGGTKDDEVLLCICKCGQAYFASSENDWRCRACGVGDKRYHCVDWGEFYLDKSGQPCVWKGEWIDCKWTYTEWSPSEWVQAVRRATA